MFVLPRSNLLFILFDFFLILFCSILFYSILCYFVTFCFVLKRGQVLEVSIVYCNAGSILGSYPEDRNFGAPKFVNL